MNKLRGNKKVRIAVIVVLLIVAIGLFLTM